MTDFKYRLEKYKGAKTRFECPSCGRNRCFTRYINSETGEYLNYLVGKCDHVQSCGYHLSPKKYFENSDNKNQDFHSSCNSSIKTIPIKKRVKPIDNLDKQFLFSSIIHNDTSDFELFLRSKFKEEDVNRVKAEYFLGCNKDGHVVYWQIDNIGRIRTGKIMAYNPITGKRLKQDNLKIKNYNLKIQPLTWVHSELKRIGLLPKDWELSQCLFGLHLSTKYPNSNLINIVESEKTAVIMACVFPEFIWMASGGVNNLNAERLYPLKGKNIVLYPDIGCYKLWFEKVNKEIKDQIYNLSISNFLEKNKDKYRLEDGDDLADLYLSFNF